MVGFVEFSLPLGHQNRFPASDYKKKYQLVAHRGMAANFTGPRMVS